MWGIVPAAGRGSRIQPLAFSKELLPVGSRMADGIERPCAVSEYLVERMMAGGADKICFVIAPGKSDILEYYGGGYGSASTVYVVQPNPAGLCDAVFRAAAIVPPDDHVLVGLPDTVWQPRDAFAALPDGCLSFLLFPVDRPEAFDAVVTDADGRVREIQVKRPDATSRWIWGGFKMPGRILHELEALWHARGGVDEFIGTLVNAWIGLGGEAWGIPAGRAYVDVGTIDGYRAAVRLLGDGAAQTGARVGLDWPAGRPASLLHHAAKARPE